MLAGGVYAGVVFNRPIEQVLTYRVPGRLARSIWPGSACACPWGGATSWRSAIACRSRIAPPADLDPTRIKEVVEVLDPTPLDRPQDARVDPMAGGVLRLLLGPGARCRRAGGGQEARGDPGGTFLIVPEETREAMRAETSSPGSRPSKRPCWRSSPGATNHSRPADVCRLAKCSPVPIQALQKMGLVHSVRRRLPLGLPAPSDGRADRRPRRPRARRRRLAPIDRRVARSARLILTAEQAATLARIEPALEAGGFAPFLIHGVTGSGKTEVYLSAIERVVARGREAIVLVPEISLTPQTIRRFRRRFARVAVLHSHLSDAERHRHWQSIASGEIQVVVGVRSAIFAPARRLGLIVIDEEHESTFKQETTPRYHGATWPSSGRRWKGSRSCWARRRRRWRPGATPSAGAIRGCRCRRGSAAGPCPRSRSSTCGTRRPPLGGLSESLRQAMIQALQDGGQVILLLNRRGFHTFVICPQVRPCRQVPRMRRGGDIP